METIKRETNLNDAKKAAIEAILRVPEYFENNSPKTVFTRSWNFYPSAADKHSVYVRTDIANRVVSFSYCNNVAGMSASFNAEGYATLHITTAEKDINLLKAPDKLPFAIYTAILDYVQNWEREKVFWHTHIGVPESEIKLLQEFRP